jgi:hypothetical protein
LKWYSNLRWWVGPSSERESQMITVEYDMLQDDDALDAKPGKDVMHWVEDFYREMRVGHPAADDVQAAVLVKRFGPGGGNPVVNLTFSDPDKLREFSRVWVAAETGGNVQKVLESEVDGEFNFAMERAVASTANF